jgi:ABC-type branched-subunit amino acid transport system substrate-binding protein
VADYGFSRRTLLRTAGAGVAVLGGGSLIEACSSGIKGASSSSSSSGGSTQLTIGWIHPLTGSLAGFGYPDNFVLQQIQATSQFKNGIKAGGKTYKVTVKSYDTQSSVTRAGSLAKQAIQQDNVDLLFASGPPRRPSTPSRPRRRPWAHR